MLVYRHTATDNWDWLLYIVFILHVELNENSSHLNTKLCLLYRVLEGFQKTLSLVLINWCRPHCRSTRLPYRTCCLRLPSHTISSTCETSAVLFRESYWAPLRLWRSQPVCNGELCLLSWWMNLYNNGNGMMLYWTKTNSFGKLPICTNDLDLFIDSGCMRCSVSTMIVWLMMETEIGCMSMP